MIDYVVLGGGAAGCAAAFTLSRAGHRVTLLEASDDLGGRTRTVDRDGFGVELGAIYMLSSYSRCVALLEQAGAADLLEPWSPRAGLWDGTELHELRYDYIPSFFKLPFLSFGDKIRLALRAAQVVLSPAPKPFETDSLARFDDGEDMESWARRTLGDALFEGFVRPMIEPSFGVDCRNLSTPYLRGVMKTAHKAKFRIPVHGMGSFCEALVTDVDVRLGDTVVGVTRLDDGRFRVVTESGAAHECDGVVAATPAPVTAAVLDALLSAEVAAGLVAAPYATMAHVVLRWDDDPWPDHLVEMVLPFGPGPRAILGTIVKTRRTSRLVPERGRLTNSYFSDDASRELTDEQMVELTLDHLGDVYGHGFTMPKAEVIKFDRALASCPPGHYARMQALRTQMPAGITLAGDYLAHLGVETAVISGERAAADLLRKSG